MIRKAVISDLSCIKLLADEFKPFHFNADRAMEVEIFHKCIEKHLVLVAEEAGEIVGVSCGMLVDSLITHEKVYQDLYFYIKPAYKNYTRSLLNALYELCRGHKVRTLIMASLGDNPRLDKLYELMGFKLLEKHFYKELQ